MNGGGGMLDYVRSTCSHVGDVNYTVDPRSDSAVQQLNDRYNVEYDGEYHPDPEQTAIWEKFQKERPTYNGDWRYVNCGPAKVRQLLAVESDPEEIRALKIAEQYWAAHDGYGPDDAHVHPMQVDEPREAIHTTMREMHANLNPVRWEPESMGSLVAQGNGPRVPNEEGVEVGLFEEVEGTLNSSQTASELYFDAVGWAPSMDDASEIDLCLEYNVDEVVNY